ncbi:PadR family transcriptional regulator [Bacillus salacetis]|uniref:PadR family transcriptional regulator n=1 Tax=Bacillus salacetis TaxID=2315464 RepID=UPI003BA0B293
MEDRLKRLRTIMEEGTFKRHPFTEEKKDRLKKTIHQTAAPKEQLTDHILQILTTEKTGHEVFQQLCTRGINNFKENQGLLYTNLHSLENNRLIVSQWSEEKKLYRLTEQGRKKLRNKEKKKHSYKALLEGE